MDLALQPILASIFQYYQQVTIIPGTKNYFYEWFIVFDRSHLADRMAPGRIRVQRRRHDSYPDRSGPDLAYTRCHPASLNGSLFSYRPVRATGYFFDRTAPIQSLPATNPDTGPTPNKKAIPETRDGVH